MLKLFYYFRSRFGNKFAKDVYFGFLVLRPICIISVIVYNYVIEKRNLQIFMVKRDKHFKKRLRKNMKKVMKKSLKEMGKYEGGDDDRGSNDASNIELLNDNKNKPKQDILELNINPKVKTLVEMEKVIMEDKFKTT
jgi:hypothetical protein